MTQDDVTGSAPDQDSADTAAAEPVTIAGRMASAGIGAERAAAYLERGDVQLDGEQVTDPATPAPWGTSRWAINPA